MHMHMHRPARAILLVKSLVLGCPPRPGLLRDGVLDLMHRVGGAVDPISP